MSLERFRNPVITYFTYNLTTLPGALLYFYENNSDTPKDVYQDKDGITPHAHPVVADANGTFPPIFLDGLYRAELKSASGVTQPNWPVDNVGTDDILVAANISSNNFSAAVSGSTNPGVTWSDVDGRIRITFAPATFRQAIGVDIGDLNAIAFAVDEDAAVASQSAAVSVASANFVGSWADLVGALNVPASVWHDDKVWLLLNNLADVTMSEPGVTSDWADYSGSVAGIANPMTTAGDIIVAGTGGTPTRVAKGANNTFFGVGPTGTQGYLASFVGYGVSITIDSLTDLNTLLPPHTTVSGLHTNARYCWFASSPPANAPSGFSRGFMDMSVSTSGQRRTQVIYHQDSTRMVIRNTNDSGVSWTVDEFVREAPIDGKPYARQDAGWVGITPGITRLAQGAGTATYGGGSFTSATDVDNIYTMNFADMAVGDMLEIYYAGAMTAPASANTPALGLKIGSSAFTLFNLSSVANNQALTVFLRAHIIKTAATTCRLAFDISGRYGAGSTGSVSGLVQESTIAAFNTSSDIIIRASSTSQSRTFARNQFYIDLIRAP